MSDRKQRTIMRMKSEITVITLFAKYELKVILRPFSKIKASIVTTITCKSLLVIGY